MTVNLRDEWAGAMFRILVANSKGGSGKTTVTTTLAGHFAGVGKRTALVDCDPQGSSLAWCQLRAAHLPAIHGLSGGDPNHGMSSGWMLRMPTATEVVLIDTPAGLRAHELEPFGRQADVLLIPIVPSPIDLRATLTFLDNVRRIPEFRAGKLRVGLIANRLRERTHSARDLDATLQRLTQTALIRVRDAQVYVSLTAHGQCLFDDPGAGARAHREDWRPLIDWLTAREAAQTGHSNVTALPIPAHRRGDAVS